VSDEAPRSPAPQLRPEHVRAVRLGHGANCSSVGSVIDVLFVGTVVLGATFAAICAAMQNEPVRVVGEAEPAEPENDKEAP
jgi:hypothetical protein